MLRIALQAAAHWLVSLGLLFHAYPWAVYSAFDFPTLMTLVTYLLGASLLTVLTYGLFLLTEALLARCRWLPGKLLLAFSTSIGAVVVVCVLFGPGGWDWPGTRLRGIFFSEWNFVAFFIYAGIPACLLTTVAEFFRQRRLARVGPA